MNGAPFKTHADVVVIMTSSKVETDRYSFDDTPGITTELVEKIIADIDADYPGIDSGSTLKGQYVNNRIRNATGKSINFNFKSNAP